MKEFELIHQYFSERGPVRKDVVLGIGDDAAILKVPAEQQLVVATDTLVEGTHFFKDADPKSVGHKALVANISDFAAMGAEPVWASVALTIPEADLTWVEGFSQGLYEVAEYYNVQVIGGDTT
jgi:thiamine-monophosphate kinase